MTSAVAVVPPLPVARYRRVANRYWLDLHSCLAIGSLTKRPPTDATCWTLVQVLVAICRALSLGGSLKSAGLLNGLDRLLASSGGAAIGSVACVATAYFLAAQLGLALRAQPSDVAVFWPASGVAAGILIVAGRRAYSALIVGVVVGTVAANLLSDRSLLTAILKGLCNAGEAVLVAWLIEKWFGPQFALGDMRRVVGFLAAAALAAAASAIGGAATMTLLHTTAPFTEVWRDWFLSDGVGIVAVAPLVIGLGELWRRPPARHELIEGLGVLTLLVLVSFYVVSQPTGSWLSFSPGAAVLPLLLWLAARCPPPFVIAGAFFASAAVICATSFGIGHFGDAAILVFERAKGAQAAVMTVTVYSLALAALFATRLQGERALEQSTQRLRQALDGAALGAFSANLVTRQLECDVRTAEMHGHNVPPTTIKESRRFVHPDDLIHIDAALATAKATGSAWSAEYRVVPPPDHPHAGETRWVAVESSILRDSKGAPTGLIGVTRDITPRMIAEQALGERNLLLALAGKSARVGSFIYDAAADVMQVSDGYVAVHGLPEGTTETTRTEWKARTHPEDLARVEEMRGRAFRERLNEYSIEYRIVRSNGEIRWVESRSFNLFDNKGVPQRVVGVNIDVTERKRADEHRSFLNAELDHRVKNVLAAVSAIIAQTQNDKRTSADFVATVQSRIKSLASTHELLSQSHWHGALLQEIIRCALASHAPSKAEITGPRVMLRPVAAQAAAMVLHELATNAAKYGALSSPSGRLLVRWDWLSNSVAQRPVSVEWQEIGGPPVSGSGEPGFGTQIIRELIPYEVGGTVALTFAPGGVQCRLELPADSIITDDLFEQIADSVPVITDSF